MPRVIFIGCLLALSCSSNAFAQPDPQYRVFWVDTFNSTINNHTDVDRVVNNAVAANANAIFVQVRRRGDAFYLNSLEPLPEGHAIEPGFDPLQDLIDTGHAAGLEVHAYVIIGAIWNRHPRILGPPSAPNHVFNLHSGWVPGTDTIVQGPDNWLTRSLVVTAFNGHRFGNDFWLDLGHPDAAAYTADVLRHLVANYDVDGLHFDRVRYPEFSASGQTPANGTSIGYNFRSIQRFEWVHDRPAGGPPPATGDPLWMQWRRDQVSNLVRRVYLETIAAKPWVKVSASLIVFGGAPATWGGAEAYWRVYQDWDAWLQEGILDLAVPMNYKREHNPAHVPLYDSWNEWIKNHQYGRASLVGIGVYLNGVEGSLRQIRRALAPSAAGNVAAGVSFFSMANTNQSFPSPPSQNNDPTPINPFAIPPSGTPTRPFAEFASALRTGKSIDGLTLYEPEGSAPVFETPAPVPTFSWKATPQVGHLKGVIRDATGAEVDTGAVTIARVAGDELAPGRRSVGTATDGNGFYGGLDLAIGRYQVSVTPVRQAAYVHQCTVEVTPGQVSTLDIKIDADAPQISLSVTPGELWPPNGTLHTITAAVSASDASAMSLRLTVADEYGAIEIPAMTTSGGGPLTWAPTFDVEAARRGDDLDARVYTVTLTATDAACNTATATATVRVLHDQRVHP